ncbi:MAG: cobalamin-dependent protein [Pirellulales bacterium]|nr:cobalamin-dependent protein [Pirellulales bacterium]
MSNYSLMNQLLYEGKAKNIKEAAREHKSSIVGMNALLTTTMPYMKVVIDGFAKEEDLKHIKMCVGGAPVSEMFAEEIGADGYAADASSAVELFNGFISEQVAST